MDLARVIGCVVATVKYPTLRGTKLAVIQPLDENLKEAAEPLIAVDPDARCGLGEYVFYVAGGDAALLEPGKTLPSDASIVGIVDTVDVEGKFGKVDGGLSRYRKFEQD